MKTIIRFAANIFLLLVTNQGFNFTLVIRIHLDPKLWLSTRRLLDVRIEEGSEFVVCHLLAENLFTLFRHVVDNFIFNLTKYVVALLDHTLTLIEASHGKIDVPLFVSNLRRESRDTERHVHLRNLKSNGFTLLCREYNLAIVIVGNLDIIDNLVELDHHGIVSDVS